ncbi:hypothetical protein [Microbacterium rhizomatis]|uniref:DUF3137 domain-containing protein n=1 Tax=Microbacterium rhizomatis TaxID=1631477 RepID=A0A5J5J585_9MICO|nr:hypothetical protein [Microbacterium rhizomatis]KAA9108458.1 hypothetical protein F6B43_13890 [Microbacterium rhizomatis]
MSSAQPSAMGFDPRPLTDPVDRAASRAYIRRLRAEGRVPSLFSNLGGVGAVVVGGFIVVVFAGVFLSIVLAMIDSFVSGDGFQPLGLVFLLFPVVILAVFVTIAVSVVRRFFQADDTRYRLDAFARANGMTFIPSIGNPPLPGMIFGIGGSRVARDVVRAAQPRFAEFGNYRYTTGSGKDRTTHDWGYVAIRLDTPLPNIVLDAVGNNGLFGASNLPASFAKHQRLSLEGDFDTYFSLYCPEGYERDALYLFTPDIMERFVDNAAALDVEIVDDWLFLYGQRSFSTIDPHTWAWLFSVVGALNDKFAQWARWRDERLSSETAGASRTDAAASAVPFAAPTRALTPPPGVAPQGRRLTRRFPWAGVVVLVAFAAFWIFTQFSGR